MLLQEACGIKMLASDNNLDHRLNAVDQMLSRRDGILVDPMCIRLLNGFFGGYVYEENIRMGFNEFKPLPKKNKFSHVMDALQYVVVKLFSPLARKDFNAKTDDEKWDEAMRHRMSARSYSGRDMMPSMEEAAAAGQRVNNGGDPGNGNDSSV